MIMRIVRSAKWKLYIKENESPGYQTGCVVLVLKPISSDFS
jgi:hypothetical protein